MNVLIIGAVAAGMSAASKLKRLDPSITITVLEKGTDISYGACGLPYFISDLIKDERRLIAKTPEDFKKEGISLHLNHEATRVSTDQKIVYALDLETHCIKEFNYDKLIIATGAHPIRLPMKQRFNSVYTLNSLEDARKLKIALRQPHVKTIAVIGAGYIGLETVENLVHMEKNVLLIEREDRVLTTFEPFISETILKTLNKHGVTVKTSETVEDYQGDNDVDTVVTDQASYPVDLVIEAIGVKPNTAFLENTPIKRLRNGAIITDEFMRTNIDDIYAAGDCVAYYHRLKKTYDAYLPLGTHANKAGRVIAEHIAGNHQPFSGVIGSSVLKVFDLEIARTGLSLKEAHHHHTADHVTITAKDKSGYYPGAKPIEVMVIYAKDHSTLLGAQMIGEAGVAHRINVIATAISAKMTAQAFSGLDLAYSPPFSSVYDPLQIATNQIKPQSSSKRGDLK